jgi:type II secretion system (T2SS) protein N
VTRTGILFVLLFVITLIGGVIAFVPLSFAMRQSGIAEQGVGWQQARGSIWHGQVTGLSWRSTPLGAVNVESDLLKLFTGGPSHEVIWNGPIGQGRGKIKASRSSVQASDLSLNIPLTARVGADARIANLGSSVRLSQGYVKLSGSNCEEASGTVTSDVVRLAAASFGRDWPVLSGPLSCSDKGLIASLSGDAADGTRIVLNAGARDGVELELTNFDDELRNALLAAGFSDRNGAMVYTSSVSGMETRP